MQLYTGVCALVVELEAHVMEEVPSIWWAVDNHRIKCVKGRRKPLIVHAAEQSTHTVQRVQDAVALHDETWAPLYAPARFDTMMHTYLTLLEMVLLMIVGPCMYSPLVLCVKPKRRLFVRSVSEPVVWTNLLFFVNAILWAAAGLPYTSLLVALTGGASLVYHLFKEAEPISRSTDICFAHAALVWTLWVSLDALTLAHWAFLGAALGTGLWFKRRAHATAYETPHTVWHVCVFVGQSTLATACLPSQIL